MTNATNLFRKRVRELHPDSNGGDASRAVELIALIEDRRKRTPIYCLCGCGRELSKTQLRKKCRYVGKAHWKTKALRKVIAIVALMLVAAMSQAAQVTMLWDAVEGAQGYRLYQGRNSGVYGVSYETTNTTYAVTNLSVGVTYYFAVTAFDDFEESDKSAEAQWNSTSGAPSVTIRRYAPVRRNNL